MGTAISSKTLEQIYNSMNTGSLDRAILNNLRGINHRQIPTMLPSNKEMPGLTFFTRPQLNMRRDNLRNVRQLSQLLNMNPISMQTYIRAMLDPRLVEGCTIGNTYLPPIQCPIIDNQQAFIPFLTNNIVSQSGWPSISVPTFTSKAGLYNESIAMVDGRVLNNGVWDLNVNFRNTRGNPILNLFYIWALYMSFVFEGRLVPYLDMITENEIDYCTRVYRLTMDYRKQRVMEIAACHAAFPVGVPIGDAFNDGGGVTYSEANKEIGMSFKCVGVDYIDSILIKEFNETVCIFNPAMYDNYRDQYMMKVPWSLISLFNNRGYPRIDSYTTELQWYVPLNEYNARAGAILGTIPEYNSNEEVGS